MTHPTFRPFPGTPFLCLSIRAFFSTDYPIAVESIDYSPLFLLNSQPKGGRDVRIDC